jgi:nitroimidazol reductase NimA-like FMN-containing flavoprotein (pyridoxamine 5'-phosphate oxidase superfamily)
MFGELNQEQIDQLLRNEAFGRLGCHVEGKTYIVPISYVYDGESIYGYTIDGMKLQFMQRNPEVCFQIDHIQNLSNWRSVIVWGTFETLDGDAAAQAAQLLMQRGLALIASGQSFHRVGAMEKHHTDALHQHITIYRIQIVEKTGRFEETL